MDKQTLRPSPTAILNPRLDMNFKAIFTEETEESNLALQSFLSVILGRKIRDIHLEPNEPPADIPSQMQMSFDVSVTFEDGEKASIEMQGREENYEYPIRSEVQVARLLNNNAKKGCNWEAGKAYQISVLNFHYPKDDKCELSWYTMRNQKGHTLAGHLNVIYMDLLQIKKAFGTPVEELTPLQKWGLFFSYADDESKSAYIQEVARSEEGLMAADFIVRRMSEEDANWFREFSADKARRDYNTSMAYAEKKGLENGMKKGLKEGLEKGKRKQALDTAVKLLKMKILTPMQIVQATGLPAEDVLELKKEIIDEAID